MPEEKWDQIIPEHQSLQQTLIYKLRFTSGPCKGMGDSAQFSSVAQSCPTLCDPMNHSTPGRPVHHLLPEFTQTHVHWVSQWCHPAISSSVVPFSSCPQSLPASGYFQMSQLFASGGQSVGVSASTSVLPMKTQEWSPLRWTAWISLQPKGLCPLKLQLPEGFQQSIFKGQVREEPGWLLQTSWPKNPLLLQLATKSAQDVSVNFQDKCYSLFCNFVSQYEWESVILLKVRAFRMGYSVYLRL